MGRILALDYGKKRIGVAVSDPLKMIANPLSTVSNHQIWVFFEEYLKKEKVDALVIGYPIQANGKGGSEALNYINPFIKEFIKKYPFIPVVQVDERYTSKIAQQMMILGGFKKTQRQNKSLVDQISAAIILQTYLDSNKF